MSEGGGLLGDYYTPHYEAPLGIEWHGESEGRLLRLRARRVLSSLVDMKSERESEERVNQESWMRQRGGYKICGA